MFSFHVPRPRRTMLHVPEAALRVGKIGTIVYEDQPGSVIRIRFVGPARVAVSLHLPRRCTPAGTSLRCSIAHNFTLPMPGRYQVEAVKEYEIKRERDVCERDAVFACFKACNPTAFAYGFRELQKACGTRCDARERYFGCMQSCSDRCRFPAQLHTRVEQTRASILVTGVGFLSPESSSMCSRCGTLVRTSPNALSLFLTRSTPPLLLRSDAALGSGAWIDRGVCASASADGALGHGFRAMGFASAADCEASLLDGRSLAKLSQLRSSPFVWRPYACRLGFLSRPRYTHVHFVGRSTSREVAEYFGRLTDGVVVVSDATPHALNASLLRELSNGPPTGRLRPWLSAPPQQRLLISAFCGELHPTSTRDADGGALRSTSPQAAAVRL